MCCEHQYLCSRDQQLSGSLPLKNNTQWYHSTTKNFISNSLQELSVATPSCSIYSLTLWEDLKDPLEKRVSFSVSNGEVFKGRKDGHKHIGNEVLFIPQKQNSQGSVFTIGLCRQSNRQHTHQYYDYCCR